MPGFDGMYVNGAQLVLFANSVSALDRQNILHSSLFAQLVANKASKGSVSGWQHQYDIGISHSHWIRTSSSTQRVSWPKTSCSLRTLISQMLAGDPCQRMVLAGIDQLHHPLNAKAASTLHAAVRKSATGANQEGQWLQVMVVRSAVDIHARSLILEQTPGSTDSHWLEAPLPVKPGAANLAVITSKYELTPAYAKIRAKVESALGKWPEKLTVALSIAIDEGDTGGPGELPGPPEELAPPTQP